MSNAAAESEEFVRLETYENAWAGLRLIRETVEALSPPGTLPSEDAVLQLYGPEPLHEATAISDALRKLLAGPSHGPS